MSALTLPETLTTHTQTLGVFWGKHLFREKLSLNNNNNDPRRWQVHLSYSWVLFCKEYDEPGSLEEESSARWAAQSSCWVVRWLHDHSLFQFSSRIRLLFLCTLVLWRQRDKDEERFSSFSLSSIRVLEKKISSSSLSSSSSHREEHCQRKELRQISLSCCSCSYTQISISSFIIFPNLTSVFSCLESLDVFIAAALISW